MDIRNELKSLIAKNGTTLKKICSQLSEIKDKNVAANNLTNKLRRKTIKFDEFVEILDVLDYHVEFVRNK